jgi:hypothetical protein
MRQLRKQWASDTAAMTIGAQVTIGGKLEWRSVCCPLSSADDGERCGEWCAWFGVESAGGAMGQPTVQQVTCKGTPIGELVPEDR